MANPRKENGYTPIANEILEAVYKSDLPKLQTRILLMVWRYSYGFNKVDSKLSLSFIADGLNSDKRNVQREIKSLVDKNILIVENEARGTVPRVIKFNKNYECWKLYSDGKIADGKTTNGKITDGKIDNGETVKTTPLGTVNLMSNKDKKKNLKKKGIFDPEPLLAEKCFSSKIETAVREWLKYKGERKETYTETGYIKLLSVIRNRISMYGEDAVINALDKAIAAGWKGWDFQSSFTKLAQEDSGEHYEEF